MAPSPPLTDREKNYLAKRYFNPMNVASYSSPLDFYHYVRDEGPYSFTLKQIKEWLEEQEAYSLSRNVLRNFQRGRVLVTGIDDQWEADLGDFQDYADDNDNYRYVLFVIDVFSRYGWALPIKNKTAEEIIRAFKIILNNEEGRKPQCLRTDAAKDFTSEKFQRFLKKEDIHHFVTHSEKQANYVERFIQTIKRKLFQHMIVNNNARYIQSLPVFVKMYNHKKHSGIQERPIDVNEWNESRLWWQWYWPKEPFDDKNPDWIDEKTRKTTKRLVKQKKAKFAFKVGDLVRISYIRTPFQREYSAKWTREIFRVTDRFIRQKQRIYKLVDWDNDPVEGTFYEYELQRTTDTPSWKIEKVLKYQGRGAQRHALVQWKGWPKKFNSWIPVTDIQRL